MATCPVGYIVLCFGYSLEWLGRDAFVDEFYLREEYRGRGWGRATMAFVEEAARDAGVRALHLEVVRENVAALKIYSKMGFQEHESTFLSKWIARDRFEADGAARVLRFACGGRRMVRCELHRGRQQSVR